MKLIDIEIDILKSPNESEITFEQSMPHEKGFYLPKYLCQWLFFPNFSSRLFCMKKVTEDYKSIVIILCFHLYEL